MFCCCVRRSSCASWRIMRLLAAGSRFASKALSQSSTFCSSATFHRPHFFRFIRFRYRFNTRHTAVSADQHTLRQLQVKADITDIVAQNIQSRILLPRTTTRISTGNRQSVNSFHACTSCANCQSASRKCGTKLPGPSLLATARSPACFIQ